MMGSEEQTITVADLSASDQMIKFCLDNNIQKTVIDELLDRGFDSIPALSLVEQEDLKSLKIPVGQRRLILHITKSLKNDDSHDGTTETSSGTSKEGTSNPGASGSQTAGNDNVAQQSPLQQQPDLYQHTLLNTLLAQQAQLAAAQGPRLTLPSTHQTTAMPSATGLTQPSWQDPQVHIATATGKSSSAFYDICDFVPTAVEEEMVIGGQGEQQIVVKSGPKKPKLENLTLSQWSIANLGILYKLVGEGKLVGQGLMDYLSYTTKVYQLVQKCSLTSVLLYDREYRQLQANMGFRWGTDVQHLHTLHLQSRDKQTSQGYTANQKKGTIPPQGPKRGGRQESDLCRNFNTAKGCSFQKCKFRHACIVPGCNKPHPVTAHTFEK